MKFIPGVSLRARLVVLLAICTLPAIGVMVSNAVGRYYASLDAAYRAVKVSTNEVEIRYRDLVSGSRNTLALMAALPAVTASPAECGAALAKLRAAMPLYANLDVVTLNGEFRCSALPYGAGESVTGRTWFQQVIDTQKFTSAVIPSGVITHGSLLVFSAPHYGPTGELLGALDAVISPQALAPAADAALSQVSDLTVFAADGTLLMRSTGGKKFDNTDQSRTPLFRALSEESGVVPHLLPGVDGTPRLYVLTRTQTEVPGVSLYIASGIDRAVLRKAAFLPLIQELGIVIGIALLMMLWAWWGTTLLVTRRLQPLLEALGTIGTNAASAPADIVPRRDEFTLLREGIDSMAQRLEQQTAARLSADRAREVDQLLYKDLVEQSGAGICVRHPTGELVLVNQALCEMLGYTREELLRMRLTDLIDPTEERKPFLKPGIPMRFDSWMLHKDGHRVPVAVSSMLLPGGDIQSVQQDLSEREDAERALASERLFQMNALSVLPGVFLVYDAQGKLLRWNRGTEEASGYSAAELAQMRTADLTPPELRARRAEISAELLQGKSLAGDTVLYTKAGARVPYYYTARGFRWRGENCVVGMGVDLSARVRTQRTLEEERLLQRKVINSLPGLFAMFNVEGQFLRWNSRLERVTGYSREEIQNLAPLSLIVPEERRRIAFRLRQAFRRGAASLTTTILCRDGRRIPHHFTARSLNWHGQSTLIGVAVDVTEHLQSGELLRNYVAQVEELSRRLVRSQEEERRHMAAELHDELGQGLLAVILTLKDLEKDLPADKRAGVEKACSLTVELSEQVRKLSLDLRPSMLDDLGLAPTVRWYLRESPTLAGLKIKLHMPDTLPRFATATELTCFRVLQAALTNTVKHANAARVSIWLNVEDNKLRLAVQDDGQGFDVEAARARSLAGKSFGLLGTEERVHLAGGEIEIHSAPGEGTRVEATLPVTVPDASETLNDPSQANE